MHTKPSHSPRVIFHLRLLTATPLSRNSLQSSRDSLPLHMPHQSQSVLRNGLQSINPRLRVYLHRPCHRLHYQSPSITRASVAPATKTLHVIVEARELPSGLSNQEPTTSCKVVLPGPQLLSGPLHSLLVIGGQHRLFKHPHLGGNALLRVQSGAWMMSCDDKSRNPSRNNSRIHCIHNRIIRRYQQVSSSSISSQTTPLFMGI